MKLVTKKAAAFAVNVLLASLGIFLATFLAVMLWSNFRPKECSSWEDPDSFHKRTMLMDLAGELEEKHENGRKYVRLCD